MQLNEAIHTLAQEGSSGEVLIALAHDSSVEGRRELFETVRDLFLDTGPSVSDRERALMGGIIHHLVHDLEMTLRRDLAERLAERPDTPQALIVQLANDEYEIAHPILLKSEVLQDPDLVEIVKHRTLDHQLAVSRRKTLSESVSKALVDTGHEDVIESLLKNHGATISREVIEFLVEESRRVDSYQNPLISRPDLPPELAQRMYWWVSAALRKHMTEHFNLDKDFLDNAIETVTAHELKKVEVSLPSKSEPLVDRVFELGELNEAFLVKTLRSGEILLFESSLCKLSGLKPEPLRRILFEPGGAALAILCRAIGLELETYMTFFELIRQAKDGQIPSTVEQKEQLARLFQLTRREDAEGVLGRWRRSAYLANALDRLSVNS